MRTVRRASGGWRSGLLFAIIVPLQGAGLTSGKIGALRRRKDQTVSVPLDKVRCLNLKYVPLEDASRVQPAALASLADSKLPLLFLECILENLRAHQNPANVAPLRPVNWTLTRDMHQQLETVLADIAGLGDSEGVVSDGKGFEYKAAGVLVARANGFEAHKYFLHGRHWLQVTPMGTTVGGNKLRAGTASVTFPMPSESELNAHEFAWVCGKLLQEQTLDPQLRLLVSLLGSATGAVCGTPEQRLLSLFEKSRGSRLEALLTAIVKTYEAPSILRLIMHMRFRASASIKEALRNLEATLCKCLDVETSRYLSAKKVSESVRLRIDFEANVNRCRGLLEYAQTPEVHALTPAVAELLRRATLEQMCRTEMPHEDLHVLAERLNAAVPRGMNMVHIVELLRRNGLMSCAAAADAALFTVAFNELARELRRRTRGSEKAFCDQLGYDQGSQQVAAGGPRERATWEGYINWIQGKIEDPKHWRHLVAAVERASDDMELRILCAAYAHGHEMAYLDRETSARFTTAFRDSQVIVKPSDRELLIQYMNMGDYESAMRLLDSLCAQCPSAGLLHLAGSFTAFLQTQSAGDQRLLRRMQHGVLGITGSAEFESTRSLLSVLKTLERHLQDTELATDIGALYQLLVTPDLPLDDVCLKPFEKDLVTLARTDPTLFSSVVPDTALLAEYGHVWTSMTPTQFQSLWNGWLLAWKTTAATLLDPLQTRTPFVSPLFNDDDTLADEIDVSLEDEFTKSNQATPVSSSTDLYHRLRHIASNDEGLVLTRLWTRYVMSSLSESLTDTLFDVLAEEEYMRAVDYPRNLCLTPADVCRMRNEVIYKHNNTYECKDCRLEPMTQYEEVINGLIIKVRDRGADKLLTMRNAFTKALLCAVPFTLRRHFVFDCGRACAAIPMQISQWDLLKRKLGAVRDLAERKGTSAAIDEWRDAVAII